jgi:hypothetical protein
MILITLNVSRFSQNRNNFHHKHGKGDHALLRYGSAPFIQHCLMDISSFSYRNLSYVILLGFCQNMNQEKTLLSLIMQKCNSKLSLIISYFKFPQVKES